MTLPDEREEMSISRETYPATLLGGPHDGTEVDVTESTDEVRLPTQSGKFARYIRLVKQAYQFVGYASVGGKPLSGMKD